MKLSRRSNRLAKGCIFVLVVLLFASYLTNKASGEAEPITKAREKLNEISEDEEETLRELFTITQEIEELQREKTRLNNEYEGISKEVSDIEVEINNKQDDYNKQLSILEQVLVRYQRGGSASYLELLLDSEDLTTFLNSIHLIKDMANNVDILLADIIDDKADLALERQRLNEKLILQEAKLEELSLVVRDYQELKQSQEEYLAVLKEEKATYEEHLGNLVIMWDDLKLIFSEIVNEFSRIIGEGYFTMEDMNIKFMLFYITGAVHEDTFNNILKEYSKLPEIVFHFDTEQVNLEIPDKRLMLQGHFIVVGKSAIEYVVESGSFYDMPLEQSSIDELFKNGPIVIDFEKIAGDLVLIDIDLDTVATKDGYLEFKINTGFSIFG